jgi:hypothetical protein
MSALGFILIAVIVFMLGWRLIGVTDARTTSLITGAVSLLMGAAVVFQGATVFGASTTAPIGALLLLWAVYGALVAGMGFSNVGGRALALYALFLSLAMIAFAAWFLLHGLAAGVIVTVVVAIAFFLQFVNEIVPVRSMTGFVGFVMLLAGLISGITGLAVYLGVLV